MCDPSVQKDVFHHTSDDPRFRIQPHQQIASSLTGALLTSLLMTPLDVVKTRLQIQQKTAYSNKCYLYCNGLMDHLCPCDINGRALQLQTKPHFNGTLDAMIKISRMEGASSLWSGLGPTLVLAVPTTVIYFVTYEQLRCRLKDRFLAKNPKSEVPLYVPFMAGVLSRTIAVTIVSPLELIRTKMQSQKLNYFQVGQALKCTLRTDGIPGLWRGLGATLIRDVPFSGIYWSTYEFLKTVLPHDGKYFSFFGGAVSGAIAAFITTPFDVIKTHRQIEFGEKYLYADKPMLGKAPNDGVFSKFLEIYRKSGIRGLYAGLIPRLIKVAPACAIMLGSFEYGKAYFYERNVAKYKFKNGYESDQLFINWKS